jgi:hypothetical protein
VPEVSPLKKIDEKYEEFVRAVSQEPGTIYVSEKLMQELRDTLVYTVPPGNPILFNSAVVAVDPLLENDEMRFVRKNA